MNDLKLALRRPSRIRTGRGTSSVPASLPTRALPASSSNGGAAGVDGVTFRDLEREGVAGWLRALAAELK